MVVDQLLKEIKRTHYLMVVLFILGFVYFYLSSSSIIYPGETSFTLAAAIHAKTYPVFTASPFINSLLIMCARAYPDSLITIANVLSAICGGLFCAGFFRGVLFLTRYFCIDFAEVDAIEQNNILRDNDHAAFMTAIIAVALLFTSSTYLMQFSHLQLEAFAYCLVMAGFAFCSEFRFRIEYAQQRQLDLCLRDYACLGLGLICLSMTLFTGLELGGFSALIMAMALRPLFRYNGYWNKGFIPVILASVLTGLLLYGGALLVQADLVGVHQGKIAYIMGFFVRESQAVIAYYCSSIGIIHFVFMALLGALFVGNFPYAYMNFKRSIFPSLIILILLGFAVFRYPVIIWGDSVDVSMSRAIIILMLGLNVSEMIGGWFKCYMDYGYVKTGELHLGFPKLFTTIVLLITIPSIGYVWQLQSPQAHTKSLDDLKTQMMTIFEQANSQQPATTWIAKPKVLGPIVFSHYAKTRKISISSLDALPSANILLGDKSLAERLQEDPVLAALYQWGKLGEVSKECFWYALLNHPTLGQYCLTQANLPLGFAALDRCPLLLLSQQGCALGTLSLARLEKMVDCFEQFYCDETFDSVLLHTALDPITETLAASINSLVCLSIKSNTINQSILKMMRFAYLHGGDNPAYLINYYTLLKLENQKTPPDLKRAYEIYTERNRALFMDSYLLLEHFERANGALNAFATQGRNIALLLFRGDLPSLKARFIQEVLTQDNLRFKSAYLYYLNDVVSESERHTFIIPQVKAMLDAGKRDAMLDELIAILIAQSPINPDPVLMAALKSPCLDDFGSFIDMIKRLNAAKGDLFFLGDRILSCYMRSKASYWADLYVHAMGKHYWKRALAFTDRTDLAIALKGHPLRMQAIRLDLYQQATTDEDKAIAYAALHRWVSVDSSHYLIWQEIFKTIPKDQRELREMRMKECLNVYPAHQGALATLLEFFNVQQSKQNYPSLGLQ